MKSDWYKDVGRDEKEKLERIEMVRSARPTLEVLKNILEERNKEALFARMSKAEFDKPSWAYSQADYIGYARALNEVITLLTIEKGSK